MLVALLFFLLLTPPPLTHAVVYRPGGLITDKVFFNVSLRGDLYSKRLLGRIVIGLFGKSLPRTTTNFRELATGSYGFGYAGTTFHRVLGGMLIQGGDVSSNSNGAGGKSIYGDTFADEGFFYKHFEGCVSMANKGTPDTNNSQFFIVTGPAPHLDGKHVVFGKVLEGMEVVKMIESARVDADNRPLAISSPYQSYRIDYAGIY